MNLGQRPDQLRYQRASSLCVIVDTEVIRCVVMGASGKRRPSEMRHRSGTGMGIRDPRAWPRRPCHQGLSRCTRK
jgi:hypothetical protein